MAFQLNWVIQRKDEGKLVRDFLHDMDISRTALTDIKFKGGMIQVNEKEVNVRFPLRVNDVLKIIFPAESPSEGVKGENILLDIFYEDNYLLVVNKPPGMNTIPSREHPVGSLANGLVGYYEKIGLEATSHIVTRLDRDTSGLVLIAKHRHVHHLFSKMQQIGRIKRTYEALVGGNILTDSGTIEEPIGRKSDSIIEREVRLDGQYACTHFNVLERFAKFTRVELQLETGRTHQIRVHMAFLGHPLLGDDLYGGDTALIARQALHCKEVKFAHPFTQEELKFTASLPDDLENIIKADHGLI